MRAKGWVNFCMMTIRKTIPSAPLREYVRNYELRALEWKSSVGVRPLPARAAQLLIFHLADRLGCQLLDHRSGKTLVTPPAGVAGPQTFRAWDALWRGQFRDFVVSFQPAGFYRLFGLPMIELADRTYEASELMGTGVRRLHEQLYQCPTLNDMARVAESFLMARLGGARRFHAVQTAATMILTRRGHVKLDDLVYDSGLSQRQFERKFAEQIGMGPKHYCRVARLNYVLRLKEAQPDRTWTELAYEGGYFDQTHLVKDFKLLAGATPTEFSRLIAEGFAVPCPSESVEGVGFLLSECRARQLD